MKTFSYGVDNPGTDYRMGKLMTAARYNHDPGEPDGDVYKVTETYVYGDAAGRKTHRLTDITKGFGADETQWEAYREVMTDMIYNDLNLPGVVQYPYCVDCSTPAGSEESALLGHKKALVQEHYETGKIDKQKMKFSRRSSAGVRHVLRERRSRDEPVLACDEEGRDRAV